MPRSATSKDVVNWIAMACDQSPELALHHVVIHAHGDDAIICVGQDADGNDNNFINILNVADFQPLASRDIGCIWFHACGPAATNLGAHFCLQLAANSGTTVVAAADDQYHPSELATLFMPGGSIDDFEGPVYQFSADGLNYWLINPNGGTFAGPPTVYSTQG
jgi:hypothetical protein